MKCSQQIRQPLYAPVLDMTFFVIPEIPEWFGKAAQSHFRESGKALFLNLSNYHTRIVAEEMSGKIHKRLTAHHR